MARLAVLLPVNNRIYLKKLIYLEPDGELARLSLSLDYPLAGSDAYIDTDGCFSRHWHDSGKCSGAYCEWLAGNCQGAGLSGDAVAGINRMLLFDGINCQRGDVNAGQALNFTYTSW